MTVIDITDTLLNLNPRATNETEVVVYQEGDDFPSEIASVKMRGDRLVITIGPVAERAIYD